jgi:hypothetical protein
MIRKKDDDQMAMTHTIHQIPSATVILNPAATGSNFDMKCTCPMSPVLNDGDTLEVATFGTSVSFAFFLGGGSGFTFKPWSTGIISCGSHEDIEITRTVIGTRNPTVKKLTLSVKRETLDPPPPPGTHERRVGVGGGGGGEGEGEGEGGGGGGGGGGGQPGPQGR